MNLMVIVYAGLAALTLAMPSLYLNMDYAITLFFTIMALKS